MQYFGLVDVSRVQCASRDLGEFSKKQSEGEGATSRAFGNIIRRLGLCKGEVQLERKRKAQGAKAVENPRLVHNALAIFKRALQQHRPRN